MFGSKVNGTLGILAGSGDLPLLLAQSARAQGTEVVVIGIDGHTDRRIEAHASRTHYIPLGKIAEIPKKLVEWRVKRVAMAGSVPKREIYNPALGADSDLREVIEQKGNRGDDHLLRAFEIYLRVRCGVSVVDARHYLKDALAVRGPMTRRVPDASEKRDVAFGRRVAAAVGRLDIGQTVVVKQGIVLSVEALEGTDAAIRRGGELGREGAVVVKTAKPNQDLRFDLPCVGPSTIESMRAARCRTLALEAGKTLVLSKSDVIRAADAADIAIAGF